LADSQIFNLGGQVGEGVQAAWEAEIRKQSQNWNPSRHKPLLGRKCVGALGRSCLLPTSLPKFHDEAASEYDAAFDWYLARSPDGALKFDAEVDRALAEIMQAPQRWAVAPCSPRRFLLRQFPYYSDLPGTDVSGHSDRGGCSHQPEPRIPEAATVATHQFWGLCSRRT
jgi:hypothetical protein